MRKFIKYIVDGGAIILLVTLVLWAIWLSLKKENLPERIKKIEQMKKGNFEFSFLDLNNKQHHLTDFHNQIVLVNIWATWCLPCVEELPSLIKLAHIFPKKLTIIAVTNESSDVAEHFLKNFKKFDKNFIVATSYEISQIFSPQALPESYLFDKKGQLSLKIIGPRVWNSFEWQSKINQLDQE